jgi:hypothetical protein
VRGIAAGLVVNAGLFFAGIAPAPYQGYLTGYLLDKNQAGLAYTVAGVLLIGVTTDRRRQLAILAVTSALVWASGSRTSLAALAFAVIWFAVRPRISVIARLVLGTSMGCMHIFVWGEAFPNDAQALMPLACQTVALGGRNRMWRKMAIDGIKAAKEKGFLVCTNTTVYKDTDMNEIAVLLAYLTELGVDGFMMSPAYGYSAVEQTNPTGAEQIFMTREDIHAKFQQATVGSVESTAALAVFTLTSPAFTPVEKVSSA